MILRLISLSLSWKYQNSEVYSQKAFMLLYFYNSWKLFWNQSIIPPLCSCFLKWQHSLTYILLFCQFQSNFWRQFKMSSNSFSWNCSLSLSFIDGVLLVGCCNFKRRGIPQLGTNSNLDCESGLPVGRSKKWKWQLVGVKVDWKFCFFSLDTETLKSLFAHI